MFTWVGVGITPLGELFSRWELRLAHVFHQNYTDEYQMRYAIADIHGGNLTFQALLRKIDFRRTDQLFLLGDYVDRGPDSMGVLETMCCLIEAGYDVRPIRGNHDEMLLRTIINDHDDYSEMYFDTWGRYTLESFEIKASGHSISKYELLHFPELIVPDFFPSKYLNLLESLPYIQVEPDYIFVHAGLDMSRNDPFSESDSYHMLWSRSITVVPEKMGGRQLVTGHMVRMIDDIRQSLDSTHIRLDNGAFTRQLPEMGNLVALNLDTKELIVQPWCDGEAYD